MVKTLELDRGVGVSQLLHSFTWELWMCHSVSLFPCPPLSHLRNGVEEGIRLVEVS